jgi:hypothetical protein
MDAEAERREAAAKMGRAKTPAKIAAAQATAAARRGVPLSEEHKAKIADRARERWATVHAQAGPVQVAEKKRPGRPRKEIAPDAPTRGRGRPKKQDAPTMEEAGSTAQRGTQEAETA